MYGMDMCPDLRWVTVVEISDGCDLQIGCERETKGVCVLLCDRDQGEGGVRERQEEGEREAVLCVRD